MYSLPLCVSNVLITPILPSHPVYFSVQRTEVCRTTIACVPVRGCVPGIQLMDI